MYFLLSIFHCSTLRPAYDEFMIMANSYRYAHAELKQVYFAVVDYEEAPQIFQAVGPSKRVFFGFWGRLTLNIPV